jgi:hypothetical protein
VVSLTVMTVPRSGQWRGARYADRRAAHALSVILSSYGVWQLQREDRDLRSTAEHSLRLLEFRNR